ncbi:hypothetical protein FOCC_FOCC000744, partial [Frankliniella occidentalis]
MTACCDTPRAQIWPVVSAHLTSRKYPPHPKEPESQQSRQLPSETCSIALPAGQKGGGGFTRSSSLLTGTGPSPRPPPALGLYSCRAGLGGLGPCREPSPPIAAGSGVAPRPRPSRPPPPATPLPPRQTTARRATPPRAAPQPNPSVCDRLPTRPEPSKEVVAALPPKPPHNARVC